MANSPYQHRAYRGETGHYTTHPIKDYYETTYPNRYASTHVDQQYVSSGGFFPYSSNEEKVEPIPTFEEFKETISFYLDMLKSEELSEPNKDLVNKLIEMTLESYNRPKIIYQQP